MKLNADLFPYPVLSSILDDYVDSKFEANPSIEQISKTQMELNVSFKLENDDLYNLISSGKANFAVHVEGIASSYREIYMAEINQKNIIVPISSEKIGNSIEVNMMVIATEKITNYSSSKFNKLYYYSDYTVNFFEKGDILAFVPYVKIDFEFENKENPNSSSMIRVSSTTDNFMSVDIDSDVINVKLPKDTYTKYIKLSKRSKVYQDMLLATIILPALTHVIYKIQQGEEVETKKWYISLEKMLEKRDIDRNSIKNMDALKLAQELLDYPILPAVDGIYMEGDEED